MSRITLTEEEYRALPQDKICHADKDGDCNWKNCPQLRDGEPEETGRHCPIDYDIEEG